MSSGSPGGTTASGGCSFCVLTNGICQNGQCRCFAGYLGYGCQDRVTTATPASTTPSSINIAAIVASVLGSVLVTLLVVIIIFCIWRHRVKKKTFKLSTNSSSTTTNSSTQPVVAPALYNLSLSEQYSISNRTESYHLYDELP